MPVPFSGMWSRGLLLSVSWLAVLAAAQEEASLKTSTSGHRVIVQFAGAQDAGHAAGRAEALSAKRGVTQVKALPRIGMAVVTCSSEDAQAQLVRELEGEPALGLATPDSWLHFLGGARGGGGGGVERPLEDLRQCSAQSGCAALSLVGNCCPADDGMMLACCDGPTTQNLIALRSFHRKFVVAEESGAMNANRDRMDDWEKFQIFYNDDGSVSLRSYFGKYVSAERDGGVNANRDLIRDWERFQLIRHEDSTISLKSFHGKYVVAESDGALNANRDRIDDWEKFEMLIVGGPTQRFPNDANFSALWGMHNFADWDIDAPEAWKTFTGEFSAGVVVAVIDTGIDYNHEDLRENMWVNPGEIPGNGLDDDGNGFVDDVHGADFANEDGDPMDDQMHGTHCAGTIAGAGNNGLGVTGVSWRGVRLMALKFLTASGSGRTSDAVQAIDYAVAHGARVASNSWGGGGSSAALRIAIERAEAAGVLFVAAAGNSGTDNDEEPQYPANYPAANIISVASTTSQGELSGFSCYGARTVDLAAPGSSIYSTVPGQGYRFLSGTSMATPHVSGLAALVWMYRPALEVAQVKEVLMASVRRSEALQGRVLAGGRINAKRALEAASAFEPPRPPVHAPQAVAFEDSDPRIGSIAGVVTITAAADESDVEYYTVFFVSGAGFQLDAVGNVTATGARLLQVPLASTAVPRFARSLVAVAGNASGEMPAQLGGGAPNATIVDLGVPEAGPRGVSWGGDVDLRAGFVAGTLSMTRAADEASVSHYNIYWASALGARGPLLGSIPATGFREPRCQGPSCSVITNASIPGGYRFDRGAYGDNELAAITASGPGTLTITRFDTEAFYDTLSVGTRHLSGQPSVPAELSLPEGLATIMWSSDFSITDKGWTVELRQAGAGAEFRLAATVPLGRGLEVVAAFGSSELPDGLFVELEDFDRAMPPSPGFAPTALRFTDLDMAQGAVAGTAEIWPAPRASSDGSVTYYQLDFADAEGRPIGDGWNVSANGTSPSLVSLAASPLPAGAAKLLARAGNSFGLGLGGARVDLVDAFGSPPMNLSSSGDASVSEERAAGDQAAELTESEQGVAADGSDGEAAPAPSEQTQEPWLRRPRSVEARLVVWPAEPAALVERAAHAQSRVLGAITIPGLDAHAVSSPVREAFRLVIAADLPEDIGQGSVRIRRVLAVSGASSAANAPAGRQLSAEVQRSLSRHSGATRLEFEVTPAPGALALAPDRVEARLILLSMGGSTAQRFDAALVKALAAAGAKLPRGTRSCVSEPQQVSPESRGRALMAVPDPSAGGWSPAHPEGPAASPGAEDDAEAALRATAAAALVGTLALIVALVLTRRRRLGGRCNAAKQVDAVGAPAGAMHSHLLNLGDAGAVGR